MQAAESRGSPVIPVNRGLYERLVRAARGGQPITYAEVGRLLELSIDYPPHRTEMYQLLGVISRHEAAKGRPLMTSVVLDRDEATPGKVFYRLGQELGLVQPSEDEISFAIRQLNDTFAFWQSRDAPTIEQALRASGDEVVPQVALQPPQPGQRQALGLPFGDPEDEGADEDLEDELDPELLAAPAPQGAPSPAFGQITSVRPHPPAPPPSSRPGPTYAHSPRLPAAQHGPPVQQGRPGPAVQQGAPGPSVQQGRQGPPAVAPQPRRRAEPDANRGPDSTEETRSPADSPGRAAAAGLAGGPSAATFAGGQIPRPPIRVEPPHQPTAPHAPGAQPSPEQHGSRTAVESVPPSTPAAPPSGTGRPATPLTGNKQIEDAAIRWVMQLERVAGRNPVDRRYEANFPGDIDSAPRTIEVKAVGGSVRGWFLPLEVRQMEEARRNRNFYVYVVENTKQGDPSKFTLKVLGGTRLQQLLLGAKERRYYEVPWPSQHYDQTAGMEALTGHGPDAPLGDEDQAASASEPMSPARSEANGALPSREPKPVGPGATADPGAPVFRRAVPIVERVDRIPTEG